jgi:hypothetical protein
MTLFADQKRWAIICEKSGYTPRGFRVELHITYLGNCLENLKPIPNSDKFYNTEYLTLIDGNELKKAGELKLRGQYVKLPDAKDGYLKWVPDIMTREFPEEIEYQDIARYLAYEYEELCRATDAELRSHIPHDLPRIMVIDEWHHKTYIVYKGDVQGDPPSTYETYRLIAEVLETKNPSRFKPTRSPNNHWINWPYAGSL